MGSWDGDVMGPLDGMGGFGSGNAENGMMAAMQDEIGLLRAELFAMEEQVRLLTPTGPEGGVTGAKLIEDSSAADLGAPASGFDLTQTALIEDSSAADLGAPAHVGTPVDGADVRWEKDLTQNELIKGFSAADLGAPAHVGAPLDGADARHRGAVNVALIAPKLLSAAAAANHIAIGSIRAAFSAIGVTSKANFGAARGAQTDPPLLSAEDAASHMAIDSITGTSPVTSKADCDADWGGANEAQTDPQLLSAAAAASHMAIGSISGSSFQTDPQPLSAAAAASHMAIGSISGTSPARAATAAAAAAAAADAAEQKKAALAAIYEGYRKQLADGREMLALAEAEHEAGLC